jgi:hypothetical protein
MMFITHIIKTIEYFAVMGLPEITPETFLVSIQAIIYDFAKLASIYFAMF